MRNPYYVILKQYMFINTFSQVTDFYTILIVSYYFDGSCIVRFLLRFLKFLSVKCIEQIPKHFSSDIPKQSFKANNFI